MQLQVLLNKMTQNKQIVFVNQSAGYLMIDIVDAFKDIYDDRILMTGFLNPRNKNLDKNVKIIKIASYNRSSAFKRLLSWFFGFFKALVIIKFKYPKAHLFLVSNPPFSFWIPLFCKNTFDLLVYDIYPDALVEFGYFKPNAWFVKKWENANRKVFLRANKIVTLTEGMQQRLTKYVDINKIQIIPIWTDNAFLKPIPKSENSFLKAHQLQDKFVIMYSGNMGKSHPVEILVQLAKHFHDNPHFFFLLIGGGDKYKELETSIDQNNLKNIKILPWQEAKLLPFTLSGADLALVTVGNEASDLSIPSKTYNLMSVGTPILCVAPKEATLARLVEAEKIGRVFEPQELYEIVKFINDCIKTPTDYKILVDNALILSANYSSKNAQLFK